MFILATSVWSQKRIVLYIVSNFYGFGAIFVDFQFWIKKVCYNHTKFRNHTPSFLKMVRNCIYIKANKDCICVQIEFVKQGDILSHG